MRYSIYRWRGDADRQEYLAIFWFAYFLQKFAVGSVYAILNESVNSLPVAVIVDLLLAPTVAFAAISVTVRRLRDLGWPSWMILHPIIWHGFLVARRYGFKTDAVFSALAIFLFLIIINIVLGTKSRPIKE